MAMKGMKPVKGLGSWNVKKGNQPKIHEKGLTPGPLRATLGRDRLTGTIGRLGQGPGKKRGF